MTSTPSSPALSNAATLPVVNSSASNTILPMAAFTEPLVQQHSQPAASPASVLSESAAPNGAGPSTHSIATPEEQPDPAILDALRNVKERLFVLKLGEDMESLIGGTTNGPLEVFPPTSYQRMLVHRCATYYRLALEQDAATKTFTLTLATESRIPLVRVADLVPAENSSAPAFKIMRRSANDRLKSKSRSNSADQDSDEGQGSEGGRISRKKRQQMTIEEREAAYQEARSRIFTHEDRESPANGSISASHSSQSLASFAGTDPGTSVTSVPDEASISSPSGKSGNKIANKRSKDRRGENRPASSTSFNPDIDDPDFDRNGFVYPTLNEAAPSPYDYPSLPSESPTSTANGPVPPPPSHPYGTPYAPPFPGYHPSYVPPYPYYYDPRPYGYPAAQPPMDPQATSPTSPMPPPPSSAQMQYDPYGQPIPTWYPLPAANGQVTAPYLPMHSPHQRNQSGPPSATATPAPAPAAPLPPQPYYPPPNSYYWPQQPQGPAQPPYSSRTLYSPNNSDNSNNTVRSPPINGRMRVTPPTSSLPSSRNSPAPSLQRQWGAGPVSGPSVGTPMRPTHGDRRRTGSASSKAGSISSRSGSTGAMTPADETGSIASSETSSSSSRKTFTSSVSSQQHPLPPRPDWAIGLSASRSSSHRSSTRASSTSSSPSALQDFPPLPGIGAVKKPDTSAQSSPTATPMRETSGSVWKSGALTRSMVLSPASTSSSPATYQHRPNQPTSGGVTLGIHRPATVIVPNMNGNSGPSNGLRAPGQDPSSTTTRLDEHDASFNRPPPKSIELFNPRTTSSAASSVSSIATNITPSLPKANVGSGKGGGGMMRIGGGLASLVTDGSGGVARAASPASARGGDQKDGVNGTLVNRVEGLSLDIGSLGDVATNGAEEVLSRKAATPTPAGIAVSGAE